MNSGQRPLVVVVGHFPPPVHGMALATDRLCSMIAEQADVRRIVLSTRVSSGLRHHVSRIARCVAGIIGVVASRPRSSTLYLGSDAGKGMVYTLALVLAGRAVGFRVFLHHHSAAYVSSPSHLMAAVVRVGGSGTVHVLSCISQAHSFEVRYRPLSKPVVVPISFAVSTDVGAVAEGPGFGTRRTGTLMLGHLSNLSVEKGLRRVFETFMAALSAGLDVQLLLAGPPSTPGDEAELHSLLAAAGPRVIYVGPVDAAAKRRFFSEIEVFLFPTRYRHESFGLVAGEAMLAGVPIIAYEAGCLNSAFVGAAGIVLAEDEDFPARALAQLRWWVAHPEDLSACGAAARHRSQDAVREASLAAAAFVDLLVAVGASV